MDSYPSSYSLPYDLEGNSFYEELFNAVKSIDGSGYDDLEELEINAPQDAYVVKVELPLEALVARFRSISVVERLISVERFPVPTPKGPILREQWIRATRDVFLARITSIRDCVFLLVARVFEVKSDERNLSLKVLRRSLANPSVLRAVERIAEIAPAIRDERNLNFHRGQVPALGPYSLYYSLSNREAYSSPVPPVKVGRRTTDLPTIHRQVVSAFDRDLRASGGTLFRTCVRLLRALEKEFWRRWGLKNKSASRRRRRSLSLKPRRAKSPKRGQRRQSALPLLDGLLRELD